MICSSANDFCSLRLAALKRDSAVLIWRTHNYRQSLSRQALFSLSISAVDRIDFAAAGNCTTARGSFNFLLPSLYTLTKYYYTVIRSQCETQPLRCGWFTDRKWSPPLAEKSISAYFYVLMQHIFTLFWSPETSTKTSLKRENRSVFLTMVTHCCNPRMWCRGSYYYKT